MTEDVTKPWYEAIPWWAWLVGGLGVAGLVTWGVQTARSPEEKVVRWGWEHGRRGWSIGKDEMAECRAEYGFDTKKCKRLMSAGSRHARKGASWGETKRKVLR